MLRRLILHLGMGKTGSTTIQTFLKKNQERLRREGFLAFGPGDIQPDPHHNLLDTTRFLEAVDEVVRRITEADADSLIWSLEGFGTRQFVSDPARIETILSKLRATEVRLVVYLRRQDTFAPSAYLQWNVTHKAYDGPVRSFDELFPSIYNEGPGKPLEATNLNYYEVVRPWVDAFGLSQMRIRSLERAQLLKGDLVADFEDAAGLPDINYDRDVPPKNVTFNMELTDMLGMYVSTFEGPVLPGSMDWFFYSFGRDDYFSEPFFTKFELPPAQRREILEACEPFNARVAREYLGRDDGVLFAEPWPAADASYKPYDGLTLEKLVPILLYIMRKQQAQIAGLYTRFNALSAGGDLARFTKPRQAQKRKDAAATGRSLGADGNKSGR